MRLAATNARGNVDAEAATPHANAIATCLADVDVAVCKAAAEALGKLGLPELYTCTVFVDEASGKHVRFDYNQHAMSAMINFIHLLEKSQTSKLSL